MTNEEKIRIAVEVAEGKRPESDLEKYGIALGEPKQIDPKTFFELLEKEQSKSPPRPGPSQ